MERRALFATMFGIGASVPFAAAQSRKRLFSSAAVEVFGIIRFPTSGPIILNDANHTPKGLTGVSILASGLLCVTHTDLVDVGVSFVNPDETLVGKGIMVGNSQGFDEARFQFYDASGSGLALNLNNAAHYAKLAGTSTNIWFGACSSF